MQATKATNKAVEFLPLTAPQKWFMGELPSYKNPGWACLEFSVKTKVPMNEFALKEAAWYLVARHENLRVKLYNKDGQWMQELFALSESNVFDRYDLSMEPEPLLKMKEICIRERDLLLPGLGNVIRILFFRFAEKEGRVWFCVHHIVSDFVSMLILSGDFLTAYNTIIQGKELKRQVMTDYRKWVYIVNGYVRDVLTPAQLDYWLSLRWDKARLLPGDYPGKYPDLQAINEAILAKRLVDRYKYSQQVLEQSVTLRLLGRFGLEFESVLIAVFFIALCQRYKVDCLDIAASHAGRNLLPADYGFSENRLVGFIALVRVLLLTNPHYEHPVHKVQHVVEQIKAIPAGGIGFTLIKDQMQQGPLKNAFDSFRRNPQIFFNYLGATSTQLNNEQYEIVYEDLGRDINPPEMKSSIFECNASVNQGRLQLMCAYIEDYTKESTVRDVLQLMTDMLQALVVEQEAEKAF